MNNWRQNLTTKSEKGSIFKI